jgi:hypothetical protein
MKTAVLRRALFVTGAALAFHLSVQAEDATPGLTVSYDSSQGGRSSGTSTTADSTVGSVPAEDKTAEIDRNAGFELLAGNLPKIVQDRGKPYLVTSDVYVPSGKIVRIEPGVVMLFKNFTGMHVEGRLVAEGTAGRPIVFSSEFDKTFNPTSSLHANPFDWNGVYIHENGLGSSFTYAKLQYSVFGINSLTKYFKLDNMTFSNNGRSDLIIEGKEQTITTVPFSYALSIDDARKDGVPVKVLMDPHAKKRNILRYSGLSLLAGGCIATVWSAVQFRNDQQRVSDLSNVTVSDANSNLVRNKKSDWEKAQSDRNLDAGLTVSSFVLAFLGGVGFGFSFTF